MVKRKKKIKKKVREKKIITPQVNAFSKKNHEGQTVLKAEVESIKDVYNAPSEKTELNDMVVEVLEPSGELIEKRIV